MKYVDSTRQELLVDSRQFPGAVIVHHGFDKARLHWHEGFEVLYVHQCCMHVVVDGQLVVLQDGEVLLIPPRSLHAVTLTRDEDDVRTPEALSITIDPLKLMALYPNIIQAQQRLDYSTLSATLHTEIARNCSTIFQELSFGTPVRWFAANCAFYGLMTELFTQVQGIDVNEDDTKNRDAISQGMAYVQEHYNEPLQVSVVASLFGYSREYFSRLFKSCTGMTFKRYLVQVRLEHTCRLLVNDRMAVNVAWRLSGFPNEKSFRLEFAKEFECSPEEYRQRHDAPGEQVWSSR